MLKSLFTCWMLVVLLFANNHTLADTNAPKHNHAATDIRSVINTLYDTPDHTVVIEPIVIDGEHALASWTLGAKGGRVIMQQSSEQQWEIVLCSGKHIKEIDFLESTGIPTHTAQSLVHDLMQAEQKLGAETIKRFDSFNAIVRGSHYAKTDNDTSSDHAPATHD